MILFRWDKKQEWIRGGFEYLHADANVTANAGAGGSKFSVDDDGTQLWPNTKVIWGPSGTRNHVDTAAGLALPVQLRNTGGTEIGTAGAPVRTDPTGSTTQPVSGTVTITPSGTQTVAGAKTNNNAAPGATNIGALPAVANAAAPTQTEGNLVALRATLSGDLAVTLDSEAVVLGAGSATIGALTANQSVNISQINGVAPLMGNGASGTGAQRVTLANDSTGQVAIAAGVAEIGNVKNSGTFAVQSSGNIASGSADSGNPVKVGGKYNATPPTIADGQRADLQTDANGFLKVNVAAGGASGGTSSSYGAAVPGTGTAAGFSDGTNMQLGRVFDLDSGAGTQYGLGVNIRQIASGGSVEAGIAANPLRFDPTGTTTQPVSGTITANAGTGTFTVDSELPAAAALADAASATPSTPTVGSVGLVMNATTMDRQRAVVNAMDSVGTGIAAAGLVGQLDDVSTGTVTENQFAPVRISTRRALLVEGVASGTSIPVTPAANSSINVAQIVGTAADVNSGNKSAGTLRVTLATDQVQLTNALKVDGSAVTQPVSVAATLVVTPVPATSGGTAISTLLSAATTNGTSVKASAGQVYGWYLYNANAAVRYLKLYNKASGPTVGTDVPVMTIPIPPGSAANVEFSVGIAFATGIAFAITTGVTTADTGAVALNEIIINLLYK